MSRSVVPLTQDNKRTCSSCGKPCPDRLRAHWACWHQSARQGDASPTNKDRCQDPHCPYHLRDLQGTHKTDSAWADPTECPCGACLGGAIKDPAECEDCKGTGADLSKFDLG